MQYCQPHVELGQKVAPVGGQIQHPDYESVGFQRRPPGALQPTLPWNHSCSCLGPQRAYLSTLITAPSPTNDTYYSYIESPAPHNFEKQSPPSPVMLPFPVCKNLYTQDLKGSPLPCPPSSWSGEAVRNSDLRGRDSGRS